MWRQFVKIFTWHSSKHSSTQYQKRFFFFFRRNSKPTAETSYTLRRQNMRWRHGLRHSSSLLWQTRFEMQSGDQNMLQVGDMSRGRWEWGSPFLVNGSKLARCWRTFKWLFGTARIRKRQLLPIRMPVVNTSLSDKNQKEFWFSGSYTLKNWVGFFPYSIAVENYRTVFNRGPKGNASLQKCPLTKSF